MLRWRLISAAVIISLLVGLVYADYTWPLWQVPGLLLVPLGFLVGIMAAGEVLHMLGAKDLKPVQWSVYLGVVLIMVGACMPLAWSVLGKEYPPDCPLGKLGWPLGAAAVAVAVAFVGEMFRYEHHDGVIGNIAAALFVISYIGIPYSFVFALRMFREHEWGMVALVSTLLVTKSADAGAYFFGRKFGKRKLAPRMSPGKTVEGLLGGLVTACLVGLLFGYFVVPMLAPAGSRFAPWWGWIIFATLLTFAGLVGDLAESILKRDMHQKDSSSWLPGLGGVMDILDSVLFACPVAFLCFAAGLVGPAASY